jgi:hypothetical protein
MKIMRWGLEGVLVEYILLISKDFCINGRAPGTNPYSCEAQTSAPLYFFLNFIMIC